MDIDPSATTVGEKRKFVANAESGDGMPPAKRFKGADPESVGNRMEGVQLTPSRNGMMDVDSEERVVDDTMEDVEPADDGMCIDEDDVDDLNRRIGLLSFGTSYEFSAERITYLS